MAMMISKFHKMIQSKVIWYIVLGVIVISFVGFFTPTVGGGGSSAGKEPHMGMLFGEKVGRDEYRMALQNVHIWYILSSGQMPGTDRESVEAMQQQAWVRLAMLRKAADEKLIVSDQEVVDLIQQMPLFQNENGVFDKAAYQGILGRIGISPTQVENAVREQVAVSKLMFRPVQAALIAPDELERAYHMYTDRLVFEYAVLPREQVAEELSVSREEAEAFFAENMEQFRMPAKVRVSYVEYPVADFVAQAEAPEGAALQMYNQNIERYRVETTNETAEVEYKPFEEVEAEITAVLIENAARRLAVEKATALVADIAPKGQNEQPDFKGAAASAGLNVKMLPAFGPDDPLPGIDTTAPFRQAALGLRNDAYSSFSDAVPGRDKVYVISLEQRYESFLPDFETVETEAMEAARSRAVTDALAQRSLEIRDTLLTVLESGKSFKEAVAPLGLPVETTGEFDLSGQLDNEYAEPLISVGINAEQGELCRPVPVEDGVLFTYVAQRSSTDPAIGMAAVREELISGLSRVRSQRLAAGWQDALMDEAEFEINR
jgi:peptidyl-prolyl cis-trans isomerase D